MKFEKITSLVQTFPEVCRYSCSQHGEIRNFNLYKRYYLLKIWKFEFKLFESLKLDCQNCGWSSIVPGDFAKKVFKHGLRSNILIKYAKNPILASRFLNFFGYLWRVWTFSLGVLICLIIFRFYTEPVLVQEPITVSVEEAKSSKYLDKIVKIDGRVDYPLALTKEIQQTNLKGEKVSVTTEVYLPLFSKTDPSNYVVIRGSQNDLQNVLGRKDLTNSDLLNNQDYSITGRVEKIDNLGNNDLKDFYINTLPKSKNLNPNTSLINAADVVTLQQFLLRYLSLTLVIMLLLILSVSVQIYIDKKIVLK